MRNGMPLRSDQDGAGGYLIVSAARQSNRVTDQTNLTASCSQFSWGLETLTKSMEVMMTTQDNFIAETQKQIKDWQSQMAEYQKNLKATEAQSKTEFNEVVDQL